jgi:hypothetical protein
MTDETIKVYNKLLKNERWHDKSFTAYRYKSTN